MHSDGPGVERPMHVELGAYEGVLGLAVEKITQFATKRFRGNPSPQLSKEPEDGTPIRGGAHMLGPMGWRVWPIPNDDPIFDTRNWYGRGAEPANWLPALEAATFQINWAANVPFAIAYVSFRFKLDNEVPSAFAGAAQHVIGKLFEELPGRFSANNVHPRVEVRWIVGAKVSEARMARIRTPIELRREGAATQAYDLRKDLAKVFPMLGAQDSSLVVAGWATNLSMIHGEGGSYLGESGGPFSAYCYSTGRLMAIGEASAFLPFWGPRGLQFPSWHDFNFLPFVMAARQFVAHTLVEGGKVEEGLSRLTDQVEKISHLPARDRMEQWARPQQDLLQFQARIHRLEMDLHMGVHRTEYDTRLPQAKGSDLAVAVEGAHKEMWPADDGPPRLIRLRPEMDKLVDEARALLSGHSARVGSALGAISTDFQWYAAKSMREWTIGSVVVAGAALLVSALAVFAAIRAS